MNMNGQYLSSGTRTMLMLCVAIVLISEACVLFVLLSAPGRNVGLDFIQYDWWGLTFGLDGYSGVTCTTCSPHAQ